MTDAYRDALEDILRYTDGKRMLSARTVAEYLGIDQRTARKRYEIPADGIMATRLARMLCR